MGRRLPVETTTPRIDERDDRVVVTLHGGPGLTASGGPP